eukprot:gene25415-11073_t
MAKYPSVNFQVRWKPYQLDRDAPKEGISKLELYRKNFEESANLEVLNALVEELFLNYFTQEKFINSREVLLAAADKVGLIGAAEYLDNDGRKRDGSCGGSLSIREHSSMLWPATVGLHNVASRLTYRATVSTGGRSATGPTGQSLPDIRNPGPWPQTVWRQRCCAYRATARPPYLSTSYLATLPLPYSATRPTAPPPYRSTRRTARPPRPPYRVHRATATAPLASRPTARPPDRATARPRDRPTVPTARTNSTPTCPTASYRPTARPPYRPTSPPPDLPTAPPPTSLPPVHNLTLANKGTDSLLGYSWKLPPAPMDASKVTITEYRM